MKAIFDRLPSAKKFPLCELLAAIQSVLKNPSDQLVSIQRLGGIGKGIWAYESQLDDGKDLGVLFSDLKTLSESAEDYVDELLGTIETITFGISDAKFLFVQSEDKEVEAKIALRFESIRDIPDMAVSPSADSGRHLSGR